MPDTPIEQPLGNGTTDTPDVARNEASARVAGYPVQHTDTGLPKFDPTTFRALGQSAIPETTPNATPTTPNYPAFDPDTFVPLKPAQQAKPATSGAKSTGENLASGFGSSAATTLENLGSVGSHIPGVKTIAGKVGDVLGLPKLPENTNPYSAVEHGIKPAQQQATQTTAGKAGALAENIAEFFGGDELLKGASLAEKAGLLAKVTKLAESHPLIAKIIGHGLTSLRGGAVVTGQELAHGATPTQAIETGATAAGLGTVTGAAIEGAGVAKNAVKQAYKAVLDTKSIQPVLQNGIRDTLANVAEDSGVVKSAAPSIRDVAEDTADAVYAKSKSQYQVLDDATGGRVQRFKDRLDNIRHSLDNLTGTEEDLAKEASLLKAQKETEDAMQEAFNDAKAKGVPASLVDEANANFKKSQALYDLDKHLKMSASGMRPDIGTAAAKNPEAVDPSKMFSRMNRLYDSGRLQQAVGTQNAQSLLEHANNAYLQQQKILANQAIAKKVGKYVAYGAGLGALGSHYIGHMLD